VDIANIADGAKNVAFPEVTEEQCISLWTLNIVTSNQSERTFELKNDENNKMQEVRLCAYRMALGESGFSYIR
jgi:hypothetical protein